MHDHVGVDVVHALTSRLFAYEGFVGIEVAVDDFGALVERPVVRQAGEEHAFAPGPQSRDVFPGELRRVAMPLVVEAVGTVDDAGFDMVEPQAGLVDGVGRPAARCIPSRRGSIAERPSLRIPPW